MLLHRLNKPLAELKVAVVTPTYERDRFLGQSLRYFRAQQHSCAALRWFVLDDSATRSQHAFFNDAPDLEYHWLATRTPLGEKRNRLNRLAQAWGADIICSMDDDDWYGPRYVQDMTDLLRSSDACFAGSGDDHYFDARGQRVLFINAVRDHMSCNGVLCYKSFVLGERAYDSGAASAEEPAFIRRDKVLQHPDVRRIHLALAFEQNTVSKRNYLRDPRCRTDLSLDDFPMQEADRQFYRSLA